MAFFGRWRVERRAQFLGDFDTLELVDGTELECFVTPLDAGGGNLVGVECEELEARSVAASDGWSDPLFPVVGGEQL